MKLARERISALLEPYLGEWPDADLVEKFDRYLQLLQHWNAKVNLTSIREPEEMVRRHFGESLFLAKRLPECRTLLDFGSGGGFPGLPIAMLCPRIKVTLAESQNKKAVFLREAVWMLQPGVSVWADRVEQMPPERTFDVVTLRAVDDMDSAMSAAIPRLQVGCTLAFFVGERAAVHLPEAKWLNVETLPVPNSSGRLVLAQLAEARTD